MSSDHDTTMDNEDSGTEETNDCVDSTTESDNYLKNSDLLAALQIDSYEVSPTTSSIQYRNRRVTSSRFFVFQNLPAIVKKRVNALKNLQLQVTNLEAKFYEEVHLLECKYNKLYYPIHEKVTT